MLLKFIDIDSGFNFQRSGYFGEYKSYMYEYDKDGDIAFSLQNKLNKTIDTIVANRIKVLNYDTLQITESVDVTNIYTVVNANNFIYRNQDPNGGILDKGIYYFEITFTDSTKVKSELFCVLTPPLGIYLASKKQAPAYYLPSGGAIQTINPSLISGKTFTNEGTAIITNFNSYLAITAGTLYGIKAKDGSIEIPCCENNADEVWIHDVVNGDYFRLVGEKEVILQDTYFKNQENGVQFSTLDSDPLRVIEVPYMNNGNLIY